MKFTKIQIVFSLGCSFRTLCSQLQKWKKTASFSRLIKILRNFEQYEIIIEKKTRKLFENNNNSRIANWILGVPFQALPLGSSCGLTGLFTWVFPFFHWGLKRSEEKRAWTPQIAPPHLEWLLTFLSHCWCKYLSRMFFFSVTITARRKAHCPIQWLFCGFRLKNSGKYKKVNVEKWKMTIGKSDWHSLCSDGISTVGKYTDGRRDDVRMPFSVLNNAKFCSLWQGRSFKNSVIDCGNRKKSNVHHIAKWGVESKWHVPSPCCYYDISCQKYRPSIITLAPAPCAILANGWQTVGQSPETIPIPLTIVSEFINLMFVQNPEVTLIKNEMQYDYVSVEIHF